MTEPTDHDMETGFVIREAILSAGAGLQPIDLARLVAGYLAKAREEGRQEERANWRLWEHRK